jgi:hypothetical protein
LICDRYTFLQRVDGFRNTFATTFSFRSFGLYTPSAVLLDGYQHNPSIEQSVAELW